MTIWLTARTAGLAALVLLTAATCLGIVAGGPSRGPGRSGARYVLQYAHRVAALLGLGALTVHIATILADSYAHVGVLGAVLPFTSGYRATWVGLGTIAAYLLVAVAATGLARGRIAGSAVGTRVWRVTHALAYGVWALAIGHGFFSGTDSGLGWVRLLYLGCLVAVPASLAARWTRRSVLPHAVPAELPARLSARAGVPS